MPYDVPPLPYAYDALEPHIDEATMQVHHDKHHQAYVDKANAALEGTEWADKPVEEVLQNLSSLPDDKQGPVRNNVLGIAQRRWRRRPRGRARRGNRQHVRLVRRPQDQAQGHGRGPLRVRLVVARA
jgi:Fe-Mn family superoxide dismutase